MVPYGRARQAGGHIGLAVTISALAWFPSAPALADQTGAHCTRIAAADERLACYDRAFGRTTADLEKAQAADTASTSRPDAAQHAAATFGAEALHPADAEKPEVPSVIGARIVAIERDSDGRPLVRLDNGQAWSQLQVADAFRIKTGDAIEIARGALGSYRMRNSGGGASVRVRRVE